MNIEQLIRPDLLDLKPYSSARDEFEGEASVYLDANENPFENGFNRYPDPLQIKLKQKIADIKNCEPDKIFLGNGSDECIDLLIRLFCEAYKDEIVSISPSYGMYAVSAKINAVKLNNVLLKEDFSLNLSAILEQGKSSKILFICSPNNPTGQSFAKKDMEFLIQNFKGIVVIDEAYIDFSEEKSAIELIEKYDNLVITQTFSKAFGLAGARLGMLFSNKKIISWLNKIKPPYNINILTQDLVSKVLENYAKIQEEIEIIKQERQKMISELQQIEAIETVFPSDSNFVLIRIKNADEIYSKLIQKGIVVRNRSSQALCSSTLRITVGTIQENEKLLHELKKELAF